MIRIFTSSHRKFVKFFTEKCEELISTALQWGVQFPTSLCDAATMTEDCRWPNVRV